MQIEHVREFLLVARMASITGAAKLLYLTQSALSRHIAALEEEVGLKLFDRLAGEVRLTEAGDAFLEYAKTIVSVYDSGMEHLSHLKSGSRPTLRIGYLCNASRRFIPKIMSALEKSASSLCVQYEAMEYGELLAAFQEKRIDVSLTLDVELPHDESLRFVPLATDRYHAVVPFEHPFATRESITIAELTESEPLLFPNEQTMLGMRRFFMQTLIDTGGSIREKSSYRDISSLAYMIEHGGGVSMMLSHHAWRYKDNFAFIPIADAPSRCHIGLMWNQVTEKMIPGDWVEDLMGLRATRDRGVLMMACA